MSAASRLDALRPWLYGTAGLLLAYLLLLHWWFSAPMLELGGQIDELRLREQGLRMEIAQRAEIERRIAALRRYERGQGFFLTEPNKELASAALVQRLEQVVSQAGAGRGCQVTARTPNESAQEEEFPRVSVQVRLTCGMGELSSALHALESASPVLFVDNLDLLSRRSYLGDAQSGGAGAMEVTFDLYGYLRSAPATGAEAAPDA
jgi:general secretion pathway protein M